MVAADAGFAQPAQVRLAANRLVEVCESLLDGELRQLRGRIAAGGAVGPAHGADPETLEHAARVALVVARQTGRGFEDYREDIASTVQVYVDQERDFIRALQLQQFELVLQPQIDLRTGRCESAELLLRWHRSPANRLHRRKSFCLPTDSVYCRNCRDGLSCIQCG